MKSSKIKLADLAQLIDLTPRRCVQLQAEGVLPKGAKVDLQIAVRAYVGFLRRTKGEDLASAKLRKLSAEGERAELELAKARGEVMPVDKLAASLGELFTKTRETMRLNIIQQLPARAAGLDVAKIREIATEEANAMFKAWEEFAKTWNP